MFDEGECVLILGFGEKYNCPADSFEQKQHKIIVKIFFTNVSSLHLTSSKWQTQFPSGS